MRYLLGKAEEDEEAIELLEDFVGEDKVFDLLAILGLNTGLNEMSGMGMGAVAGGTNKLKTKRKKDEEVLETNENIDLSIVDNVIRLIMEKGIVQ